MHATSVMRLVLGVLVVLGAVGSFGAGLATAGASLADCGAECEIDCDGECEQFASVGCGCVWYCSDGSRGEIICS